MADLNQILEILKIVKEIIGLFTGAGMKFTGELNVQDILKLVQTIRGNGN